MDLETIPTKVTAAQQQGVDGTLSVPPNGICTVRVGDWVVTWPDGRMEAFADKDLWAKFRKPVVPYVFERKPLGDPRSGWPQNDPWNRPHIVWASPSSPVPLTGPVCGGGDS